MRGALHRIGLDVVRYDPAHLLYVRRAQVLAERGIGVVVDAGANTGQFATRVREDGFRGRIVSFEPLGPAFQELTHNAASDALWDVRRLALGDRDGSTEMNVAGNLLSSSLLPMRRQHVLGAPESAYVGVERVATARLDSLRDELFGRGERLLLKLDVQGFELQVLRGAEETLAQVEAVESELSLVPLYEGQALFPELHGYLDDRGFDLVTLEHLFSDPSTGKLLQLDGLFVRRR